MTKVTITLELDENDAAQLIALGQSMMIGSEPAGIARACLALIAQRDREREMRHLEFGGVAGGLSKVGLAAIRRAEEIKSGIAAIGGSGGALQGALYGAGQALSDAAVTSGNGASQQ